MNDKELTERAREFLLRHSSPAMLRQKDNIVQTMANFVRSLEQWTPVGERLPEDNGRVLVSYRFPVFDTGPFVGIGEYFAEGDDPEYWIVQDVPDDAEVVAWKPLDAPYQPQGEGKDDLSTRNTE